MKKNLRLILGILSAVWVLGVSAQQGNPSMSQYRLGVGDEILIEVFGQSNLSMQSRLPDVGTINYPFLGELKLVGLTVSEVEKTIYQGLKGDYLVNPSVAVSIVEYRPFFIDGEVKDPGGYPYQPGLTVNKAAALAGGYTERAARSDVQIIREKNGRQTSLEVEVGQMIQPGDIITIPQRFF
ncbi:polysaccharide biosynthesis/export family protein [Alteromonas lipotrueiana]|mgnify:CR=1 FL=1|uniref:polysaccharide biosynthesis/export family protein n=1 Tax=Alteromonas lipotrueiana TaxID=2803815 RepID=UPI001C48AD39|nr:polysaccharide biosynthesis/export family protein [Alteromonas lipotrueiana]